MGIYDRDYYRSEGPSFLGSITGTPQVCKWLIIVTVAVFILQVLDLRGTFGPPGAFTRTFSLTTGVTFEPGADQPAEPGVLQGQVWRLLTHAFLHSPENVFHILWNMLFLWWFGSELEQMYGSREFLAFYLVAAVLGGVAYLLAQVVGLTGPSAAVGASGALTAFLVVFAFHFPTRTILLFFILPVPIWLFVIMNVALDTYVLVSGARTGVGVAGHLGGAVFGLAYYKSQLRLTNLLPDFRSWRAQRSRPRLRVYREEEPVAAPAPRGTAAADIDEHLEAKVDAVLAKVAKHGQNSLTENERQILMRASEVYKKKRS